MELNEKFATFKQEINQKLSCNSGQNLGMEDIMEEVHLRHSKQQNLIVFGMPEQPVTLQRDAAIEADAVHLRHSKQQNLIVFGMPEQPVTLQRDAPEPCKGTQPLRRMLLKYDWFYRLAPLL
ncbi:hypothetical protein QE152_g19862 [Popillia japonica]|uniref:Uncharacterized protein n=1 Tax=Popillia japonica TaxID=7064 RepID=A0AAW1KR81_POPJA